MRDLRKLMDALGELDRWGLLDGGAATGKRGAVREAVQRVMHGKRRVMDAADVSRIGSLLRAGRTHREVAQEMRVSLSTVARHAKKRGHKR